MAVAGTVVSPAQQSTGSTANITSLLTLTAGNLEVTTVSLIQPKLTLTSLNGAAATITVKIRDITNGRTVYRESFAKDVAADTGLVVMLPPFLSAATTYGIQVLSSNSSDTAVSWQIDWLDVGIINANTTKIGGTTQTAGRDLGTVLPNAAAGATSGLPVLDANANLLAYLRGLSPNGVDTAIGAEGAAGRLAANLLAFFNAATQNLTGACVNQTADCNAAATWQRHARVANDCVGTVWYVAVSANGGNDSNDGLTPWTPKLSLKTVIEAATAGDLVLIGPGTFALGNNGIAEPDGVVVRGSGMDVTVITSTVVSTTAIFKPGTNGKLSDLTIHGLNTDWSYQRPLGIATGQSAYTNAVGERLHIIAYSDGYYATGDSATSMYLSDCWIETKYDCVNCYSANQTLVIRNSVLSAIGPFGASPDLNYARAIVANNGGIVLAYDCKLFAQDGGSLSGVAVVYCGLSSSKVELYNCDLLGSNVTQSGPVYSLRTTSSAGSLLLVSGCEYDKTATMGTGITDVGRIIVDSSGAAYSDTRKMLGTAITEGAAGRFAASMSTFCNVASPVFTAASVNQTADCNAVTTWQRHARVANDCIGTVWYVSVAANGGSDSNDGLTPWTPKLTIKTTVESAVAGDVVLIGPGTFTVAGGSRVLHPTGVVVRGTGVDSTIIIGSGPFMIFWRPSSDCSLEYLTINTRASATCAPWGVVTSDAAVANAILRNVRLIGESDCLYLSCTSVCSVSVYNSIFSGRWDSVACDGAAHTVDIYDTEIDGQGPSVTAVETNAIRCSQGTVTCWGCRVSARLGRTGYGTNGIYATSSGNITMHGGSLFVYDANNAGLSIKNAGTGRIEMDGVEYDLTKTSNTGGGTISDTPSHSVDSNGLTIQAATNAALVANNLDHLALTPTASSDMTIEVVDNTILSRIISGGDTSTFSPTAMSQKSISTDVLSILSKFTGITYIAKWLRAIFRKDTADATAKSEINDGGGTYDESTDSLEALNKSEYLTIAEQDQLTNAATGSWYVGLTQQNIRDAMKLAPSTGAAATGSVDSIIVGIQEQTDKMTFTETTPNRIRAAALGQGTE